MSSTTEIAALRAEIAALRRELAELRFDQSGMRQYIPQRVDHYHHHSSPLSPQYYPSWQPVWRGTCAEAPQLIGIGNSAYDRLT